MWSCACAIENLWLAARAEGLGVGWVTLFKPQELAALVGAPATVATLGWLCVGWPDERPPAPGLERRGWSERVPLESLIFRERWPDTVAPPRSRLAAPAQREVVAAHDTADRLLSPLGSLGVLDRALDRLLALGVDSTTARRGALVLSAADHPVAKHGVSAYQPAVTRTAAEAAVRGVSVGAVAATSAGLELIVVDAGIDGPPLDGARQMRPADPRGDLAGNDALSKEDAERLVTAGSDLAEELICGGVRLLALGEIGIGNTTVAAALGAALLGAEPGRLVGLGAGSDSAIVEAKRRVVAEAMARVRSKVDPLELLAALGGPEIAVLTGLTLGAASRQAVVVLDGMATSVAALVAVEAEPAVAAHLVAGQRSREEGHALILQALGLEPVLDLRFRAGEGVGAAIAINLLRAGLQIRLGSARTGAGRSTGE
jgi:nicotinate-nucleotide--dimethylbenzimidazole phosphoribosyltransferase